MLKFSVLGIPVQVQWTFWLAAVLISGAIFDPNVQRATNAILACAVAMFGSILWHELGHALAFRRYGIPSSITLYHFGGYAAPIRGGLSSREDFIVSAAGPAFQLALFAVLVVILWLTGLISSASGFSYLNLGGVLIPLYPSPAKTGTMFLDELIGYLLWINLFWAIINLFPVIPLDGSRMLGAVIRNPRKVAQVSVVAGIVLAIMGLMLGSLFMPILFGMLAYESWVRLQSFGGGRGYYR